MPCRYIEWKPEKVSFYCNLCWKTADANHMASDTHKRQFANWGQDYHGDAVTREDGSHLRINKDFVWPSRTSWGSAPMARERRPPPTPPGLPPPAKAARAAIPEQHRIDSDVNGDLGDATTEIVAARTELEEVKTELVATKTEVVATRTELEEVKTELVATKTEVVAAITEVRATKTELEGIKAELVAATTEVVLAKTELAEMNITMELIQKNVDDLMLMVEGLLPTGPAHRALSRSQSSTGLPRS